MSLGLKMMAAGAAMFVFGIVFFEIVLNISRKNALQGSVGSYVLPVILVGAGVALLASRLKSLDN